MPAPVGFVTFNGHSYKYVKGLYTFAEAQSGAAAAGGYVATVTSGGENAFLAKLIAGQDLGAWLGGSDAAAEGQWRWVEGPDAGKTFWNGGASGTAPTGRYQNWSVGEPNGVWNGHEEDHLHMMANSDKWNDASGTAVTMGYFIEINGLPPTNAAPVITSNGGGATAALSIPENTTAVTRVAATDADGGALTFAISGGADAGRFAIDAASGVLSFVTAPDFEAPKDAGGNNVYDVVVQVSDGAATDSQALAVTVGNVAEGGGAGGAPEGFVTFNGHAYRYVKGLYTFAEAEAGAAAAGGYVATVTSGAENAFLAGLIAGQDLGAWLGGSDAATEGQWRWTQGPEAGTTFWNGLGNGSAPAGQYQNWSVGEPNGVWNGLEEDHVHMMANSDKWNDASGHWVTMGYFIEINGQASPTNAVPVITSNGGGPTAAVGVAENTTAVTTVTATDADGGALTFSISGGADAGRFAINPTTGLLSFVTAPDFELPADAGANNVYDVVVRVSDGAATDSQAIAVTVSNVAEGGTGGTPAGFSTFNGHHYRYVPGYFTYETAKAAAAAAGGHLATVTSAAENAFLAGLMAEANAGGFGGWLGGSDAATEGTWKWTEGPENGSTFWTGGGAPGGAYANWLQGQPSGFYVAEEDHIHMLFGTDQWNDISGGDWISMGYFVEIG